MISNTNTAVGGIVMTYDELAKSKPEKLYIHSDAWYTFLFGSKTNKELWVTDDSIRSRYSTPYEASVYATELMEPGDLLFEANGCIGADTLVMQSKYKNVITFEVNKDSYNALSHNVEVMGYADRIRVINASCMQIFNMPDKITHAYFDPVWVDRNGKIITDTHLNIDGIFMDKIIEMLIESKPSLRKIYVKYPYSNQCSFKGGIVATIPMKNIGGITSQYKFHIITAPKLLETESASSSSVSVFDASREHPAILPRHVSEIQDNSKPALYIPRKSSPVVNSSWPSSSGFSRRPVDESSQINSNPQQTLGWSRQDGIKPQQQLEWRRQDGLKPQFEPPNQLTRAKKRLSYMRKILGLDKENAKFENYLDVGCNNGLMTKEFAKLVKAEVVYGCDVAENLVVGIKHFPSAKFDTINKKFDLITCFMVFHHLGSEELLNFMLTNIYRCLNSNGYLFIREHDAKGLLKKDLDDMHKNPKFAEEHTGDPGITKYFTYDELRILILQVGFTFVGTILDKGKFKPYYSVYTK